MSRITKGVLASILSVSVWADIGNGSVQQAIDASIWKPFQDAFEHMDGEALNALYAEDVLRVTPQGLDTRGGFKQFNKTRFDANRARGDRIELDFWFDSRHTGSTVSYDVGFYRVRMIAASGEATSFFGQFHIVLKNLDGQWKIVQDWDTASIGGHPITAEDFSRRPPVQF